MQIQLHNWIIYLDTCCLSRLFDNQTQPRVRRETQTIVLIIGFCATDWQWVISDFLTVEISKNPNAAEQNALKHLLNYARQTVFVSEQEVLRALQLKMLGFKIEDALHLACAERGGVDVFLTTDDRLLRKANNPEICLQLRVRVENPYVWLQEVFGNEHPNDAH